MSHEKMPGHASRPRDVSRPESTGTQGHQRRSHFRRELHGVRGLAILLIVVFHIFADGRVSGGIDVFLAITGFLAVPSLVRRAERGRGGWQIDLVKRFSDLFRRLAMPLIPVVLTITVVGYAVLPVSAHSQMFREMAASALFFENWELVNSQLTYDAAGPDTSPYQHLWSTAIQGQFHLVMTFLVMLVAYVAVRFGLSVRRVLMPVLLGITLTSFIYAIYDTSTAQQSAYFSTFSRTWQLTGPAMLGLSRVRMPDTASGVASWVGIIMLVTCPFLFDGAAQFPGPEALWPVVGVCLILAAGPSHTRWGGDVLLSHTFFQRMGDISFSLYLWHWPILILSLAAADVSRPTPLIAGSVLGSSILIGYLSTYVLEDRFTTIKPVRTAWVSLPLAATVTASFLIVTPQLMSRADERANAALIELRLAGTNPDYPGAVAMVEDMDVPDIDPIPAKEDARGDIAWHYVQSNKEQCIQRFEGTSVMECDDGSPLGDRKLVVMTGGSHTGQWSDAIKKLGDKHGWKVVVLEKSGCLLTHDGVDNEFGTPIPWHCAEWNEQVIPDIIGMEPDLVITQATSRRIGDASEAATPGMVESITDLTEAGIPVFLFRENPTLEQEMGECWDTSPDVTECRETRDHFYDAGIDSNGVPTDPDMTRMFDTSRYLCDAEYCYSVIGNVLTFRDRDHLTATMTLTLTSYIEDEIRALAPDLFPPDEK